jgi:uncharacterized LabA/DUF88 family protein
VIEKSGQGLGRTGSGAGARAIAANDLVPDLRQKGVDMRIGLDIAFISLRKVADVLVLITGDSDFVPAMKVARR